ncbi:molybdopterin synthase subunit MoaD [Methylobacillus rhizosphaerae]|uniref:Molybdopterin synthase sulfur carrier subunit n=1 Tax=Methylobacillus rhizosphaerae TaxID=551994 RepID=A0A239AYD9_9PROT|nr:molybdopterin converting factor subunit 1 [Methylobacillus rhizosphaerae]SNR99973.1 molybdopterin synthase subunit MoaD [Methylobacillus rhizosphaerae]
MIQLLYFARLRESLGTRSEQLEWPVPASIAELKRQLAARGGNWHEQFADNPSLCVAVNQQLATETATVQPGDEIAFFPPVTGG